MTSEKPKEPKPPNRIKALREARGWSQDKLAEKSGLGRETISRLENRERHLTGKYVYPLAKALDCHPGELFRELPQTGLTSSERWLVEAYRRADATERRFIEAAAHAVPPTEPEARPKQPAKRAS